MCAGENPARWKGNLDYLLPKVTKLSRGHHAAMPYEEVPDFLNKLKTHDGSGARALELLIYTAGRTGEIINSVWTEFDLEAGVWVIPGERMKMKREHRIPLCGAAINLLEDLPKHQSSEFVFFGRQPRKPISNMTMAKVLKTLGAGEYTVHGFRSSFRDWCGEETSYPRELAEHALAHLVGSEIERAYRRGDALEKRRVMMDAWERYLGGKSGDVIQLRSNADGK